MLIAGKNNLAHLDLWTLLDHKSKAQGSRRNRPNLGTNRGELPAMLGEQLLDRHLRVFHLGRVVLAFDRKPHFTFLETIQYIALGNRVQAFVINLANRRPFFDIDLDDRAFRSVLALKAEILKIPGVPQRVEVALQSSFVVNVPRTSEDAGADSFSGNTPVTVDLDPSHQFLLRRSQRTQQENHPQEAQEQT